MSAGHDQEVQAKPGETLNEATQFLRIRLPVSNRSPIPVKHDGLKPPTKLLGKRPSLRRLCIACDGCG